MRLKFLLSIFGEVHDEITVVGFMCVVDGIRSDGTLLKYHIKDKCQQKNTFQVYQPYNICIKYFNCDSQGLIYVDIEQLLLDTKF